MLKDGNIITGKNSRGEASVLIASKANRHGLIAGATGTGKTVTLKVLAESFSDMGVPVFLADVKGDLSGMSSPGTESEAISQRISGLGLLDDGFTFKSFPTTYWDIYGKKGIPLRTTISEMGPLLLARILKLNDLQSDILSIVFKIADDNNLLLIDTKDLKAILNYVRENNKTFSSEYGKMSPTSIDAIVRAVVALEIDGGEQFFAEPALSITDLLTPGADGRGMIHVLNSESLINNGRLYSTFLLWLLSELFENLPEVGDLEKPKLVFLFDEAHLLFEDAPKSLLEKIEQVVKLIRSKGVGIYFITQNPRDIPDGVLAQLSNRIQHALRAYTPAEQKAARSAADAFRSNPDFNTFDTIMELGIGEAVVSFLDEAGTPGMAQRIMILPPQSRTGPIDEAERQSITQSAALYSKYANSYDPDSAYEFLERKGLEDAAKAQEAAQQAAAEKAASKEAAAASRTSQRTSSRKATQAEKAVRSVGTTAAGTIGRELGKQVGSKFGKFGKTLGGNVGASLGRGILSTFLKG